MQSSFCSEENKGNCVLLKKTCVPGQKGCVINRAGYKMTDFKSKIKGPGIRRPER
jgi:hypothetical protein